MSKTQEQKDKENDFNVTPKLEDAVNEHLEEYLETVGETDGEVGPPPKRKKVVETDGQEEEEGDPEEKEEEEGEEQEENSGEEDDGDNEEDEGGDDDKDDSQETIVLPDNYYRAAIHTGIKPEKIAEMLDTNPEAALQFFEKVHASTNYITKQTSSLGRKHQELEKKLVQDTPEDDAYKPAIDVVEFEKQYGEEDPKSVMMMKAMVEQGRKQHEEMQVLKKQQQPVSQEVNDEQQRIWKEVNTFFCDKDMQKHYTDKYGNSNLDERWDETLTGRQFNARAALMQEADAYIAGSKLQGVDVSYTEALERAHIASSSDSVAKIAREDLKAKVKKRSKGITVKNSGTVKVKKSTKESREKDLHDKTKARMKKYLGVNAE